MTSGSPEPRLPAALRLCDVPTPSWCLDLDAWASAAHKSSAVWRRRNAHWRRSVSKAFNGMSLPVTGDASGGLALSSMLAVECARQAGVSDLALLSPPSTVATARRWRELTRGYSAVSAVDHFTHAELLSSASEAAPSRVWVEVNVGHNRSGVRPGLDAQELVRGILRLPRVELIGVLGRVGSIDPAAIRRAVARLNELQAAVSQEHGRPLPINLELPSQPDADGMIEMQQVAEVITPLTVDQDHDAKPWAWVAATVVSRPALERAVLNVGRAQGFGALPGTCSLMTAAGRTLTGAVLREVTDTQTVLTLADSALDLVIGETVLLTASPAASDCRPNCPCYALQDFRVVGEW